MKAPYEARAGCWCDGKCQPCPYHDGYEDGFEAALRRAVRCPKCDTWTLDAEDERWCGTHGVIPLPKEANR